MINNWQSLYKDVEDLLEIYTTEESSEYLKEASDIINRLETELEKFEVQKVLESGDAIALEIRETIAGHIFTSDLEVLILAQEGDNFYDKQVVKAPKGKCARQIGNYKYQEYGTTKVIPIIDFQ